MTALWPVSSPPPKARRQMDRSPKHKPGHGAERKEWDREGTEEDLCGETEDNSGDDGEVKGMAMAVGGTPKVNL